jgi:hypothetical protein
MRECKDCSAKASPGVKKGQAGIARQGKFKKALPHQEQSSISISRKEGRRPTFAGRTTKL